MFDNHLAHGELQQQEMNNCTGPVVTQLKKQLTQSQNKKCLPSCTEQLSNGAGMVVHLLLLKCSMFKVILLYLHWPRSHRVYPFKCKSGKQHRGSCTTPNWFVKVLFLKKRYITFENVLFIRKNVDYLQLPDTLQPLNDAIRRHCLSPRNTVVRKLLK